MSAVSERGDTIIEVLFAVTVFCLVAVGGLSLMNQGTAMAQRALEIGLVRAEMDAQADALRYIHSAYVASYGQPDSTARTIWKQVTSAHEIPASQTQSFNDMTNSTTCRLPVPSPNGDSDGAPFAIDVRKLDGDDSSSPVLTLSQGDNVDATETYSRIRYYDDDRRTVPLNPAKPEGIWIQAVREPFSLSTTGVLGYYDFHIRACWFTPGQKAPVTLGTIVRLYDPRTVGEEDL